MIVYQGVLYNIEKMKAQYALELFKLGLISSKDILVILFLIIQSAREHNFLILTLDKLLPLNSLTLDDGHLLVPLIKAVKYQFLSWCIGFQVLRTANLQKKRVNSTEKSIANSDQAENPEFGKELILYPKRRMPQARV